MDPFDPDRYDAGTTEQDRLLLADREAQAAGRPPAERPLAPDTYTPAPAHSRTPVARRILNILGVSLVTILLLAAVGALAARHWLRAAAHDSLPQIDGSLSLAGLSAPITVQRDNRGIPHLRAASLDDLVLAQGFVTAQDRLWQMETLRRHAAGTLAEILGPTLIPHDRTQRTLQLRAAADRALAVLPPDQLHWLELYAKGVNASLDAQRAHLPLEFRLLRFVPAPWTPRDSLLVGIAMFQDLTNAFPTKLARETIAAKLPPELVADLYPVGSWRDHPPGAPPIDLTAPPPLDFKEVPLDETQLGLNRPALTSPLHIDSLLQAATALAPFTSRSCDSCVAGSNDWVVAGTRTASGKPLLSNDMHLGFGVPGIWYEADLAVNSTAAVSFHVAGVTLPGTPFVIVGHNDHIAWGFTNLGADVQDLTIERLRGSADQAEFQNIAGAWQPVLHQPELIHVKGGKDIALDIPATRHGTLVTPIISSLYPGEQRPISLRWTLYDPANVTSPFFAISSATDAASLRDAFALFGGPAQNMVYADDQGHIGYHAVGRVPIRGDIARPSPLQPIPAEAGSAANEWAGYIPFDRMPQAFDPPGGLLATANARVTPDDYPFPITLDWAAPYRNERIWKVLSAKTGLQPKDMLALQTDVYSDLDHVVAQRLAYALDHATIPANRQKRLHQAADLLRPWNGNVAADSPAPAIVDAARDALWPLLLTPKLGDAAKLYSWDEKPFAEEQLIMHTPARWLPSGYKNWDDLLAAAVANGLEAAHAPTDLATWRYGNAHPVDIEHPILSSSPILKRLLGLPVGTGIHPQSGDGSTVKQVGRTFGPSERFTADFADLDQSTLNLVLGQSGNPASPWFLDEWPAWYRGTTFPFPYTDPAVQAATTHTLTLTP